MRGSGASRVESFPPSGRPVSARHWDAYRATVLVSCAIGGATARDSYPPLGAMPGMRFCGNQIPRFFRVPPRSAQRAESTGGLGALAAVHSLDPLCASKFLLRSTAGQGPDFVTNQRL